MIKKWIICLFNSSGGGYGLYYPSIWHPSIPYSNSFHFQKVRWWWRYACHQCIQPHYFQPDLTAIRTYFTRWLIQRYFQMSQKDVIKWTSFIRLASFKPIFSPLTYSPVKLLFDGFVPRTNDQNEYESDAHFPSNLHTGLILCSASPMF